MARSKEERELKKALVAVGRVLTGRPSKGTQHSETKNPEPEASSESSDAAKPEPAKSPAPGDAWF